MRRRNLRFLIGCGFVVAACIGSDAALAQPPGATPEAAPAGAGAVSTDPMEAASPEDKLAARQKYQQGKAAFAAGKFDDALSGFRSSYEIVASPNSHLMVVNTLVEMEKHVEAYREAQAVVAEAEAAAAAGHPKYQATADAARRTQEWIRTRIGTVTVTVENADPGATLAVNGAVVDSSAWGQPIAVEPGPVSVVLSGPSGEERREVSVQAGGEGTVSIAPPAPGPVPDQPDVPHPHPDEGGGFNPFDQSDDQRLVSYIAGGVGATGMLLFAILGGAHLSQHGDLEDQCPGGVCPPELEDDADSGRGLQAGANVSLVIGLVGLAGGAALFFTTDWFLDGADEDGEATEARYRPTVTVGPGSIGIRGTF